MGDVADGAAIAERELRLAPVMTGGTSLAVWMGGATTELYRVLRAHEGGAEVYAGLLRLTATRPVVDVITGTSAGGLNGTLLAAATVLGVPVAEFASIRSTWLDVADLEALLRPAAERDPPSLLRGDDYFAAEVRRKLADWADRYGPVDPKTAPTVDLVTTVTTLVPEPQVRSDHFDEPIVGVDHAQRLRFLTEHFAEPRWVEKLAIAARTSASIPGVFEPSFLPVGPDDAAASGRPDLGPHASFTTSRWAVDGGVVVNLPLTEALDRIYARSATTAPRRVVVYVSPTPSRPRSPEADALAAVPPIAKAALSVVTAPRAEGVASDIDAIEARNEQARRQQRTRRHLGPWITFELSGPRRAQVYALYRETRAEQSVRAMLDRLRASLGADAPSDHGRLLAGFLGPRTALLPETIDDFGGGERSWGWGIAPVEEAVSIALGLLSRAEQLLRAETTEHQDALAAARTAVHRARDQVAEVRRIDGEYWADRFRWLARRVRAGDLDIPELVAWARRAYRSWPVAVGDSGPVFDQLLAAHRTVAEALIAATPAITAICGHCAGADGPEAREAAAVLEELELLFTVADATTVQRRLLEVHVAQTLLLDEVASREQPVELIQVSWNSWNGIDDRPPDEKLAGPELARLGAFLKASWRANDWLWGRMDAAHRMVLLLLDPQRLRQLGLGQAEVAPEIERLAGVALPEDVRAELALLDDPEVGPLLRTLPRTARLLTTVVQTAIAQEELPHVAAAVATASAAGAREADGGAFRAAVEAELARTGGSIRAEAVPELLHRLRIGSETVRTELGFGQLNRVVSRGLAVAVNALTGTRSGLPGVSRLLRPLRAPLHGINAVISVLAGGSPLARGLTALVLAAAGAVVALGVAGVGVPSGTFVLSAALLTITVVLAMLHHGFWRLAVPLALGASVITLAAVGPDLADVVFTTPAPATEAALAPGREIALDADARLRIRTGAEPDDHVEDLQVDDDAVLVLRDGGDLRAVAATERVAWWKTWGFVAPLSVLRLLAVGLTVVGLLALRRRWSDASSGPPIALAAGTVAAAVVAGFAPPVAEAVLTGADPGPRGGGWKRALVDAAADLHGYQLEVTLVLLVGAAVVSAAWGQLWRGEGSRRRGT